MHCSATATAQFQLCVQQIPQKLHLQQQICQLQIELQLAFPLQLILAASGSDSISQGKNFFFFLYENKCFYIFLLLFFQPSNKSNNLNIATESVVAKISLYNSDEVNGNF
jgi:hypothetical protein